MRRWYTALPLILVLLVPAWGPAQEAPGTGLPRFPIEDGPLTLAGPVRATGRLIETGRHAAMVGVETGVFDVWAQTFRLVRDVRLTFAVPGSGDPVPATELARWVTVRPEGTTIVYSHAAFTVRQHLLVPMTEPGAVFLLDVRTTVPLEVHVHLVPDLGAGSVDELRGEWQGEARRFLFTRGAPAPFFGLVGSPATVAALAPPALVAPAGPSRLVLGYGPGEEMAEFTPVVFAGGPTPDSAAAAYDRIAAGARRYWMEKAAHYRRLGSDVFAVSLPDPRLERAFGWAKVGLDREGAEPATAADAALRATTLAAIGETAHARRILAGLARRMMHDDGIATDSGMAGESAAARWIAAVYEYWKTVGNDAFLHDHWPDLVRAFHGSIAREIDGPARIDEAVVRIMALEGLREIATSLGQGEVAREAAALHDDATRTFEDRFWREPSGIYAESEIADSSAMPGLRPAMPLALRLLDARRSARTLGAASASALVADWGVRLAAAATPGDGPPVGAPPVDLAGTGLAALAHFRHHRTWAGYDLVGDVARATFDFSRGRPPERLSGAFYQLPDSVTDTVHAPVAFLVQAIARGLFGIETDAANDGLAVEPHLPADWDSATVTAVPIGEERLTLTIQRGDGHYLADLRRTQPHLFKAGTGPLSVRFSPALPLGARVQRITVNGRDVQVQYEETLHDVHPLVEFRLEEEALVEIEFRGGVEIVLPKEEVLPGAESEGLRILDFRREGREYVIVAEGLPGKSYRLRLRTPLSLLSLRGANLAEPQDTGATLRVSFPRGATGTATKEIRFRAE